MRTILLFSLTVILAACGYKGPLYLPSPIPFSPEASAPIGQSNSEELSQDNTYLIEK